MKKQYRVFGDTRGSKRHMMSVRMTEEFKEQVAHFAKSETERLGYHVSVSAVLINSTLKNPSFREHVKQNKEAYASNQEDKRHKDTTHVST